MIRHADNTALVAGRPTTPGRRAFAPTAGTAAGGSAITHEHAPQVATAGNRPIGKATASNLFADKPAASNELAKKAPAGNGLMKKTVASSEFVKKAIASDGFVKKTVASDGFVDKAAASSEFVKKAAAGDGFVKKAAASNRSIEEPVAANWSIEKLVASNWSSQAVFRRTWQKNQAFLSADGHVRRKSVCDGRSNAQATGFVRTGRYASHPQASSAIGIQAVRASRTPITRMPRGPGTASPAPRAGAARTRGGPDSE